MRTVPLLAAGLMCLLAADPLRAADAPRKSLLMLDFEIIDYSGDASAAPSQAARLELISRLLQREFSESHLYNVLDRAPVQPLIDRERERFRLYDCNGCELDIARQLKADRVLTGWVHKASDLIISINIEIKDANSGATVLMKSVSIRGNTDQSWSRGVRYMVRSMADKNEGDR